MRAASLLVLASLTAGAAAGGRPSASAEVVLAGGCYWGVESVFRHVRGVQSAVSGFAVPVTASGSQAVVPVEAVRVSYDPAQLSYRQILELFFTVVHDPTQLNRQGPDVGPEYRSVLFAAKDPERTVVRAYLDSLSAARVYPRPIVTEIAALKSFQPVDASQQDYAARHPDDPYIVINDAPKLQALARRFPQLYRK